MVRLTLERTKCPRVTAEKLRSAAGVHAFLKREYGCEAQEWAVAIGVDAKGAPVAVHEVAMGGVTEATVDPKVVFSGLLLMGAVGFIFCHNHPSGDTTPSATDLQLTHTLKRAGETLSIKLIDHIIVSGTQYTSFVERNLLK